MIDTRLGQTPTSRPLRPRAGLIHQPERDRTAALITEHVTGIEEIEDAWRSKGKDDVLPLLTETLDRIGAALANG